MTQYRGMGGVAMRWQLAIAFIVFGAAQAAHAAEISLGCNGTMHTKHYNETNNVSYLAVVDLDDSSILLKTPRLALHYDATITTLTPKPSVEVLKLKIYAKQDGFLFIEEDSKLSDSTIVKMRKRFVDDIPILNSLFTSTYTVEVLKDDYAKGSLSPYTGRLEIQTRYYKTTGSQYEYGWSLTADCKSAMRLF
jgi:hypothetical protein